ncbi:hypothetical protein E2562_001680 [Oryza meyeriana var. granulata]|uniref:Uncharacterized protein n=1 Tax=Oryza meyeriana var. granulata TaxID=110450 RepID=A0A6G1CCU1_9ORYZ|nr:hypothetical protein E2562_001680 [Oryza meyeriana var. granulata]
METPPRLPLHWEFHDHQLCHHTHCLPLHQELHSRHLHHLRQASPTLREGSGLDLTMVQANTRMEINPQIHG